jgi:hypothetical protein
MNLMNCLTSEPGESVGDYASVPLPSCQDCRDDPVAAEAKCDSAVNRLALGYLTGAAGPEALDWLEDPLIAKAGLVAPPAWLLIIPNGIATGCELKSLINIGNAAKAYKSTYCKCPKTGLD